MPVISTLQHLKGCGRRIAMNDVRIELKNGALFQKLRPKAQVRRMCRIGCETLRWEDFKASLGCICQSLPCTCPHPHRLVQVLWFPIHVIIGARARLESGTLEFAFLIKPLVIWGSNITLCPSFLWRMTLTWVTWSSTTWRRTSCELQPSLQTSLLGSRQFSSREGSAQRLLLAFPSSTCQPWKHCNSEPQYLKKTLKNSMNYSHELDCIPWHILKKTGLLKHFPLLLTAAWLFLEAVSYV